jgi:hypothetical protein
MVRLRGVSALLFRFLRKPTALPRLAGASWSHENAFPSTPVAGKQNMGRIRKNVLEYG